MSTLQLRTYDMLKEKLGEKDAQLFIEYIEAKVGDEVEHGTKQLATKQDVMLVREDFLKEISKVQRIIYTVGIVQFLAIVGSLIGIFSFMLRK